MLDNDGDGKGAHKDNRRMEKPFGVKHPGESVMVWDNGAHEKE